MRRKNKRGFAAGLAAVVFAVCVSITGCGGEYESAGRGKNGDAVSGTAVSGGAVSGGAVKSRNDSKSEDENATDKQQTAKKYRYSTDKNVYYEDYDGKYKRSCIMQARLDGTHKKEIVNAENANDCYLHYVDENWLYYEIEKGDEEHILYRAPIKKDAEGYDVVKNSRKEKLIRAEGAFNSSFWDSHYVIYDDGSNIVKYDVQKKKKVNTWEYTDFEADEDAYFTFFRVGDYYVALVEWGRVYVQKVDHADWEKCGGNNSKELFSDLWTAQTANNLFYMHDGPVHSDLYKDDVYVWKCDGKEIRQFITREQMEQAVRKAKEMDAEDKVDIYYINNIYTQDNRCYVQMGLGWYDGKIYRMEYLIFSLGEDESELRYEKELTECMQSHAESRNGFWGDGEEDGDYRYIKHVVVNDAQCVYMLNGAAYLSLYDYEKDQGRMGCYEFATGEFRWVTKKEAAYGDLAREGAYYEEDLDEVFEGEMEKKVEAYTDFDIEPTEVDGQGDFYETK